jgi:hypothetical protein
MSHPPAQLTVVVMGRDSQHSQIFPKPGGQIDSQLHDCGLSIHMYGYAATCAGQIVKEGTEVL